MKSAWIDYYGNVRNTYGTAGDGEIVEVDKYLVSNGISSDFDTIKELASDTSLFTGIKLEIPTDYNYKI